MSFIFLLVLQMFSSFMELFSKTRCTRYLDIRVNCVSPMSEAVAGKCAPDLLAEDARFPEKKNFHCESFTIVVDFFDPI